MPALWRANCRPLIRLDPRIIVVHRWCAEAQERIFVRRGWEARLSTDQESTALGEHAGATEGDLADEELLGRVQESTREIQNGSTVVFYDADSLKAHWADRAPM